MISRRLLTKYPPFSTISRTVKSVKCPRKYPLSPWNSEWRCVSTDILSAGTGNLCQSISIMWNSMWSCLTISDCGLYVWVSQIRSLYGEINTFKVKRESALSWKHQSLQNVYPITREYRMCFLERIKFLYNKNLLCSSLIDRYILLTFWDSQNLLVFRMCTRSPESTECAF